MSEGSNMPRGRLAGKIASMSQCGRLSVVFTALAVSAASGYSLWAGTTAGFKLAAMILLFTGVSAVLEFFFPAAKSSSSSREAN